VDYGCRSRSGIGWPPRSRWWRRRVDRTVGRRSGTAPELIVKGAGIALQNGLSRLVYRFGMKSGIVTGLTLTLWTTRGAQGKALTIKLQTTKI
jgi:hypothetical protein